MKVVEIFESMQGEGKWMGIQCVFVRFAGCNLKCPFCDEASKYGKAVDMDILQIVEKCGNVRHVVLTGGEPTLQPDFEKLILSLQTSGHYVHIETNGTNPINNTGAWITCSPKGPLYEVNTRYDELKLVVDGSLTMYEAMELWEGKDPIWLQPCDGPNIEDSKSLIVQWISKQPNAFRAGIQLHKYYEVI